MGRLITQNDIDEVRRLRIDIPTVAGYKGASVVEEVIATAVDKNMPILCIGGLNTGKSTVLKVILSNMHNDSLGLAMDDIVTAYDIIKLKDGTIKYTSMESNTADGAARILSETSSGRNINMLLIEVARLDNGKRVIKSIKELVPTNNGMSSYLVDIVKVHKDRFKLVNEIA